MSTQRYNVWLNVDGICWCLLKHRSRDAWTFKTAVKLAEKYSDTFKCTSKVTHYGGLVE
jgi:hypothetical protein